MAREPGVEVLTLGVQLARERIMVGLYDFCAEVSKGAFFVRIGVASDCPCGEVAVRRVSKLLTTLLTSSIQEPASERNVGSPRYLLMSFSKSSLASGFVAALSGVLLTASPGFPPDTTAADVTVDGVSGSVSPPRNFSQGTAARVVVTNVNPFLFQYRIQTTETTLTEPSPRDFFNFVFDLKLEKPEKPVVVTQIIERLHGLKSNSPPAIRRCDDTEAHRIAEGKAEDARRLQIASERLSATFETLNSASRNLDSSYRQQAPVVYAAAQPASAVMPAAMEISRLASEFKIKLTQSSASVATQLAVFTTSVATFNTEVAEAANRYPACTPFDDLRILSSQFAADTLSFRANEKVLASKATDATAIADEFARASDSSRYYITQFLPTYEGPTDVTITILRRPVSGASASAAQANAAGGANKPGTDAEGAFRQVAQARINVGGQPRFSIGGGIAVAWLAIQDYAATTILKKPPGDTTAIVVVATEDSKYRVVPMITLNTRLWNFADTHVTLGIGMRRVTHDNDLQYLVGLTQGFFGRRIMATAGAFTAQQRRLRPDLHVGDRLPALDGNSLIQSRMSTAFGMALTYRLY